MAITWRNVDAPDLRGAGSLLASGSELMNQGAAQIGDILQRRLDTQKANWDLQAKDNTMAAINQIKAIKDLNQLQGTDLNQILSPYGGQIDAGLVSDAFGNQGNVIAQGMQNEQTVRTLGDQKQYQSAFNQMLQAYGNGDIKTGDAISAQLQNTTYGDEAANASIAARDRLQQQRYQQAQLANASASLRLQKQRYDAETRPSELQSNLIQALVAGKQKGADLTETMTGFLDNLNPADKKYYMSLQQVGDEYIKNGAYRFTDAQAGPINKVTNLANNEAAGLDKAVKTQTLELNKKFGIDPTYAANYERVGTPDDITKYVGKDKNLSNNDYAGINSALLALGQQPINDGSELPMVASLFEKTLTNTDSGDYADMAATIAKQRNRMEAVQQLVSQLNTNANTAKTQLGKDAAITLNAYRRIIGAGGKVDGSEVRFNIPDIKVTETETERLQKEIDKRDAEIEAERKLVSELKARAKQREMPGLSSRTPTNVSVNTAIPNFVAPVGYNPVTRLSDVLDFSNTAQNAELYKQWQNDKNVSAADKRSLSAWKRYLAEHTSKK